MNDPFSDTEEPLIVISANPVTSWIVTRLDTLLAYLNGAKGTT